MKKNCWLIFGAMLSTSLLAQQVTNPPPSAPIENPAPAAPAAPAAAPAPAAAEPAAPAAAPTAEAAPAATNAPATTNAPAKTPKKKSAKKKSDNKKAAVAKKKNPAAELKTVPLVAGPAVSVANNVNVRDRASLKGDILTHLTNGQPVTVVEEIVRNDSGPDEPSAWARIELPPGAHVWVSSAFIDPAAKTVKTKKLNLRGGPGETFGVLGHIAQGDVIKDIGTKGDWTEIDPPTNACAFVAAQYLRQEATGATPAEVAAAKPAETPMTNAAVAEAPAVAAPPAEAPAAAGTANTNNPAAAPETAAAGTNTNPAEAAATPPVEEPLPKRIVQHEGWVRGTVSIQAPTHFALVSDENRLIDYLFTSSPNLDLRRYKGLRIIVTGEEGIEDRWPNTPVITIQKIQVLNDAGRYN